MLQLGLPSDGNLGGVHVCIGLDVNLPLGISLGSEDCPREYAAADAEVAIVHPPQEGK